MRSLTPKRQAVARLIDFILRPLFFFLPQHTTGQERSGEVVKKIIVFEFFFIGDLIMATPVLKALRKKYPDAEITLLAPPSASGMKPNFPWIDGIVTFHCPWSSHQYGYRSWIATLKLIRYLRSFQWDLAVELRGEILNLLLAFLINARMRIGFALTGGKYLLTDVVPYDDTFLKHQLEGNLEVVRHLGCDISENLPEVMTDQESERTAEDYLRFLKRPIIGIHPCASNSNKLWENQKWAQVIDMIVIDNHATAVLLYGANEKDKEIALEIYHQISSKDQCLLFSQSLSNLIALIASIDLLIAMDSAASHIAAAVKTPFITLFGPQLPELTRPYHFGGRIIVKEGFDCRPCGRQCINGADNRCMKAIEVEDVLKQVDDLVHIGEERKTMETEREAAYEAR